LPFAPECETRVFAAAPGDERDVLRVLSHDEMSG
jgi:hypothetical protein